MRSTILILGLSIVLALSITGSSLTFTGSLLKKEVVPGEEIYHEITVSLSGNETSMEAMGGLYGHGMGLDGARIPRVDTDEMKPYSAVGFLKLTPERAQIEEGTPAVFILEGIVPEDVGSGGRYALVEIQTPPQGEGQIGIALSNIVPIMLTIAGTELIETGEITDLNVSADRASVIFKNTGSHHFKATAEALIKNESGEVVSRASTPSDLGSVNSMIPTTSRLFEMDLAPETDLAPGTYTVEASVIHEDGTVLDTEEATFEV